ncbi:MAG: lactonase family protein [Phycisphaerales bacterium]
MTQPTALRFDSRSRRATARHMCPAAAALLLLVGCASKPDPADVTGRYILAVSDADMPATAMFDGRLVTAESVGGSGGEGGGAQDSVTIIGLPLVSKADPKYDTPFAQLMGVSNSVIGPPFAVAVTRDGNRAYVVESRGPAPAGATMMSELPMGRTLSAIDLSNPMSPALLATADVGDGPVGVDVSPDGSLVVVVTAQPRQQIAMVTATPQGLGAPLGYPLLGFDNDETARATSVQWHPSGGLIALTLPGRDVVAFYRVSRDADGAIEISTWGDPVTVGRYPHCGRFTPDGRFFITTNLHWEADNSEALVQSAPGSVSVVEVDSLLTPADRTPSHRLVGSFPVGVNPEGIAISPDGRYLAVSNYQRTMLPTDDPRVTREGSISFLSISGGSGELTSIGEYPIPGMPAGLSFDAQGKFLVVTRFRSFDPSDMDGALAFFKVRPGSLERAAFTVGVGKGPHGVLIIR